MAVRNKNNLMVWYLKGWISVKYKTDHCGMRFLESKPIYSISYFELWKNPHKQAFTNTMTEDNEHKYH